jgi:membrane fusion protein (multidrug efflux system)
MFTEKSQSADKDGSNSSPATPIADATTPGVHTGKPETDITTEANAPTRKKSKRTRHLLMGAAAASILAFAVVLGIPWIQHTLSTVSTDDAYVNGHVTFVAARVPGQVSRVLVDDNNRVHKGDLLLELDREPYEVAVAVKKAAVDTAKADLEAAKAMVRGIEAKARSQRWKLQHAMEDVENQIALLHAKIAARDKSKAALKLAEAEFDRAKKLVLCGNEPRGIRPAGSGVIRCQCGRYPGPGRYTPDSCLFGAAGGA